MAELTISSDEIAHAIENYVSSYAPEVNREEIGLSSTRVTASPTSRACPRRWRTSCSSSPRVLGVALNLEARSIGVAILGDSRRS